MFDPCFRNMDVCTNGLVALSEAEVRFFFLGGDNSLLFLETNTHCL